MTSAPSTRACQFLSSMWLLDPVHRGGDAEHTHEGAGGLFVAGGDSAPFFEPRPETLYPIAVVINPRRTGDVGFVALGRIAGWDPRFQIRSRKAWLAYPRSATIQAGGSRGASGAAVPMATRAP